MNKRVRLLLVFAAALAVLCFAVTRQLDRAEAIVDAGSDLQVRRDALDATVRQLAERAPLAETGAQHRVQVQRELRALVESAGLELKSFEWVLDGEAEAADDWRGMKEVVLRTENGSQPASEKDNKADNRRPTHLEFDFYNNICN